MIQKQQPLALHLTEPVASTGFKLNRLTLSRKRSEIPVINYNKKKHIEGESRYFRRREVTPPRGIDQLWMRAQLSRTNVYCTTVYVKKDPN